MVSKQNTPSNSGANLVLLNWAFCFRPSAACGSDEFPTTLHLLTLSLVNGDGATLEEAGAAASTTFPSFEHDGVPEKPTFWPKDSAPRASKELNIDINMIAFGVI